MIHSSSGSSKLLNKGRQTFTSRSVFGYLLNGTVEKIMECLKEDVMLKFRPDTLEAVRKELNLEKPGRIGEAVDILENWVQMQTHFVKKDFCEYFLTGKI